MSYREDLSSKRSLTLTVVVFTVTSVAALLTYVMYDGEKKQTGNTKQTVSKPGSAVGGKQKF